MTWNELKIWIDSLSKEQQDTDVIFLLSDENEFFPLAATGINEDGLNNYTELESKQPYLVIDR